MQRNLTSCHLVFCHCVCVCLCLSGHLSLSVSVWASVCVSVSASLPPPFFVDLVPVSVSLCYTATRPVSFQGGSIYGKDSSRASTSTSCCTLLAHCHDWSRESLPPPPHPPPPTPPPQKGERERFKRILGKMSQMAVEAPIGRQPLKSPNTLGGLGNIPTYMYVYTYTGVRGNVGRYFSVVRSAI